MGNPILCKKPFGQVSLCVSRLFVDVWAEIATRISCEINEVLICVYNAANTGLHGRWQKKGVGCYFSVHLKN
jgi:hypothetical protein